MAACVSAKEDLEQRWILGTVVKYSNKREVSTTFRIDFSINDACPLPPA